MPSWELIAVQTRGRVEAATWSEALVGVASQLGAAVDPASAVLYENGELEVVTEAGEVVRLVPAAAPGPTCTAGDEAWAMAGRPPALPTYELDPVEPVVPAEGPTLPMTAVSLFHDAAPDAPTQLFGAVRPLAPATEPAVCEVEWESEAVA
jgi:hypothetical protein